MNWIKTSDQLPDVGVNVLYCNSYGNIGITRKIVLGDKIKSAIEHQGVFCARISIGYSPNVTHWMPLPTKPKKEAEECHN